MSGQVLLKKKLVLEVRLIALTFAFLFARECPAIDLGASSSGKDISLDIWSSNQPPNRLGYDLRLLVDFDKYENGSLVTVCADGSISGSVGSGTCSGHGGANHTKEAKFTRYAIMAGPTYWLTNHFQLYGGLIVGLYSSDINIGEKNAKDFTKGGLDFGVVIKPTESSKFKMIIGHETERDRSYFGFRVTI